MMSRPHLDTEIFVVSHLDSLLNEVPQVRSLTPVNLEKLEIPSHLRGNALAESRFFFTDLPENSSAKFIGFVSARWAERFPNWPGLDALHETTGCLDSNEYVAPMLNPITSKASFKTWMAMQDLEHPGMGTLILEVPGVKDKLEDRKALYGYSVMGGQILISKSHFLELQEFVAQNVERTFRLHGLLPPFAYRCSTCGRVFSDGVGRWSNVRHMGFLAERYISLFFILRGDLHPKMIAPQGATLYKPDRRIRGFEAPWYFHKYFAHLIRLKNRWSRRCIH